MYELFNAIIDWYMANLNYWTIMLLMAVESSFIPFPSELVIPPAAALALQGKMSLPMIIFASTVGCVIGAMFNYVLAITLGRKLVYSLASSKWARLFLINQAKIENAEQFFLRNGNTSTLIGRLVPAVRQLISIPAGLARMNLKNFIIYTFLGSLIWNVVLAFISYFLIDHWETYYKEFSVGFIVVGIGFVVYLVYKARKKKKEEQAL